MKQNMENIDNYFTGTMTPEEKIEFEARMIEDKDLAEDVALYLSALQAAKEESIEEKKNRFRDEYRQNSYRVARPVPKIRRLWTYISVAATVLIILLGWTFFLRSPSPQQLANNYIKKEKTLLSVNMSTVEDSFARGKDLYNAGRLSEALQIFENLTLTRPLSTDAKEFTGIIYLRLEQYDKALHYFKLLESEKGLQTNYGTFYHALTLMKRNLAGDEAEARKLLQQVVDQDLAGREIADRWLKKF
jgi:tetratricopeptide (TPR) repeat protein